MRENADQGNSEYRHFSRSDWIMGVNLKPTKYSTSLKTQNVWKCNLNYMVGNPSTIKLKLKKEKREGI